MHSEFEFLKHFFVGLVGGLFFALGLVNCQIKKFRNNIHVPSPINDSVNNVKDIICLSHRLIVWFTIGKARR